MATAAALARAERAVRSTVGAIDQVLTLHDAAGLEARREILRILEEADRTLAKRLARIARAGGPTGKRFTEAQALAYRKQIQVAIDRVKVRGTAITERAANAAMAEGVANTVGLLSTLEETFTGIAVGPNIASAMRMSDVLRGTRASLAASVPTSFDRYGTYMTRDFQQIIRNGMLTGASVDQMTDALVSHGGPRGRVSLRARVRKGIVERILEEDIPEGLFVRRRYWARRIVRTEVAYAYNGSSHASIQAARDDGLPLKKKILAHFDNRTAADSIAVHGQVKETEELFQDGAGRRYLHPPARPNDRETVIPWSADWDETPSTRPVPKRDREQAHMAAAAEDGQPTLRTPKQRKRATKSNVAREKKRVRERNRRLRARAAEQRKKG